MCVQDYIFKSCVVARLHNIISYNHRYNISVVIYINYPVILLSNLVHCSLTLVKLSCELCCIKIVQKITKLASFKHADSQSKVITS